MGIQMFLFRTSPSRSHLDISPQTILPDILPANLPPIPGNSWRCVSHHIVWLCGVMLTCRYWQSGTSANRVGLYKYISHRLALIFRLKPLQSTSPVHCMAHSVTSGNPARSVRLATLLGSSTAHVQLLPGIVKTGMNDFISWSDHMSQ